MKKFHLVSLYLLLISVFFVGVVSAEENEDYEDDAPRTRMVRTEQLDEEREEKEERRNSRIETRQARVEEREEKREEEAAERKEKREAKRCEVVQELVSKRIEIFKKTKTNHQENYDKLVSRLNEVVLKLQAKGLDTTELSTDLATLETMIAEYKTKYESFVAQLDATGTVACGETSDVYKAKLEESKALVQELRQMRVKIRDFYLTEVREDIKALRELAEKSSEEENETETTSTTETSKESD